MIGLGKDARATWSVAFKGELRKRQTVVVISDGGLDSLLYELA